MIMLLWQLWHGFSCLTRISMWRGFNALISCWGRCLKGLCRGIMLWCVHGSSTWFLVVIKDSDSVSVYLLEQLIVFCFCYIEFQTTMSKIHTVFLFHTSTGRYLYRDILLQYSYYLMHVICTVFMKGTHLGLIMFVCPSAWFNLRTAASSWWRKQ
jgi:hypothetical protein